MSLCAQHVILDKYVILNEMKDPPCHCEELAQESDVTIHGSFGFASG